MTAKAITHKFASAIAEGTDPTIVGPNEWNSDHNFWLGTRVYSLGSADTITNADHLSWVIYNCGANIAANLPAPTTGPPATMPLGWMTKLKSVGAGIITLTPTGGATFNGASTPIALYTGDAAEIFSQGTVDYVVLVFRAAALLGNDGRGGKLAYVSATALSFKPFNGSYIRLNKVLRPIPIAGITGLANTGVYVNGVAAQNLAANQTYLVYVFDNGGVPTADFCTGTTHAPSATPGNEGTEVKFLSGSEDPTRTLLGMCRTNASSQFFEDGLGQFGVATWNNRRSRLLPGQSAGTIGGVSMTTPTPQGGGQLACCVWGGEYPQIWSSGIMLIDTTGATILYNVEANTNVNNLMFAVSPRVAAASGGASMYQPATGMTYAGASQAYITEGFNTFNHVAWVNTGTGAFNMTIGGMALI
jgi:hypothetical protein